jgi:hypothetical protein
VLAAISPCGRGLSQSHTTPRIGYGGKRPSADIGINVKVALLPLEQVYLREFGIAMIGTPWHL